VLKAETTFETADQLRRAHGMCTPTAPPASWKEIRDVLLRKTIIGDNSDRYPDLARDYQWKWGRGWVQLLKINPRRWKMTVLDWVFAERIGAVLADEIRKEIDAEIIKELMAYANE
jgi:hypothetical protein